MSKSGIDINKTDQLSDKIRQIFVGRSRILMEDNYLTSGFKIFTLGVLIYYLQLNFFFILNFEVPPGLSEDEISAILVEIRLEIYPRIFYLMFMIFIYFIGIFIHKIKIRNYRISLMKLQENIRFPLDIDLNMIFIRSKTGETAIFILKFITLGVVISIIYWYLVFNDLTLIWLRLILILISFAIFGKMFDAYPNPPSFLTEFLNEKDEMKFFSNESDVIFQS